MTFRSLNRQTLISNFSRPDKNVKKLTLLKNAKDFSTAKIQTWFKVMSNDIRIMAR